MISGPFDDIRSRDPRFLQEASNGAARKIKDRRFRADELDALFASCISDQPDHVTQSEFQPL